MINLSRKLPLGGHDEALAAAQEAVHLCRDAATTPRPNTLNPDRGTRHG